MHRGILILLALGIIAPRMAADDDPVFNGRPMSEWLVMLKDDTVPRKRKAAAVALGSIVAERKDQRKFVLPALARSVRLDPHETVRAQAAAILGQQPPEFAGAFVTELAECLRTEKDSSVKKEVSVTLGRIGALAKGAILPLTAILKDRDAAARAAAAEALGRIGADAKTAVPQLLALTGDPEKNVRQAAVFALGRVEPDDVDPPVAAMIRILETDKDRDLRFECVVSLGLIGSKTAAIVTAVAGTLNDSDAETRRQACLVLAKMGVLTRRVETRVVEAMTKDTDREVRAHAVRTLTSAYGAEAASTIALLTQRLKDDPDFEVRVAIAEELGSLGNSGKAAIPALRQAMKDPQIKVRDAATAAIRQIERPPPKPMP